MTKNFENYEKVKKFFREKVHYTIYANFHI